MSSIILPDRTIPIDIRQNVEKLEIEAITNFNLRRFNEARKLYQQILDLLTQTQNIIKRPIHKGGPLHMIGMCYVVTNHPEQALRYIMLAYIEDTLNVAFAMEYEADTTPAARMLRDFYHLQPVLLQIIKQLAQKAKLKGEWSGILEPIVILQRLEKSEKIDSNNLTRQLTQPASTIPTRQPLGFPQPWDIRVFIGGNYQTHMAVIRHIEKIVLALGYVPVVAFDMDIPRERTHHDTLMLLHTCRYAIFEISSPAGQLMEIERANDYNTEFLLLYSTIEPEAPPSPLVSSMILTMISTTGNRIEGYAQLSDIDSIISRFLPQRLAHSQP